MASFKLMDSIDVMWLGGEPKARFEYKNPEAPKLSPDGRETYTTGDCLALLDGRAERNARVYSIEPLDVSKLKPGAQLASQGVVWVTPWVSDGRVAYSIVCERLVPVSESVVDVFGPASSKSGKGEGVAS